jgi:antitoxin (DNA-binding transcriptional repressor) of toxin-antitoxin stability system
MIHKMKSATIRDLRTRLPHVRRLLEQEGEIVVTDHGKPVLVLRPYEQPASDARPIDYFERLRRRMPKPLSRAARERLDEANRAER